MQTTSIVSAMKQVCAEKGLSFEAVLDTINLALAAAYRKDFGNKMQNIKVDFDPETGSSKIYDIKVVVEDLPEEVEKTEEELAAEAAKAEKAIVGIMESETAEVIGLTEEQIKFNPKTDIEISKAKEIKPDAEIGEEIITKLELPDTYGRMAAQTAKQVIIQKLREAERHNVFEEFKTKEGSIVNGVIQRREANRVLIDLGKITANLPREEQMRTERYNPGENIKVLIKAVNQTAKGPEIIVSRIHSEIVRQLFALEIPEISTGTVVIKGIAREAGFRTKIAVEAVDDSIDPIGSCVGQRGSRIQTIIQELGGEKVDIIAYDADAGVFIANALSPAKVLSIEVNDKEKSAVVTVKEEQFSLAIGKEGQNVRLAAKLTGWRINIVGDGGSSAVVAEPEVEKKEVAEEENNDEK